LLYDQFTGELRPFALTQLNELEVFSRLPGRILFLHSEHSYMWGRIGSEIDEAYDSLMRSLEVLKSSGGRIIWTIHDDDLHVFPSELARVTELRSYLVRSADLLHVHSESTRNDIVEDFAADPEKIVVLHHPSYATIHPRLPESIGIRPGRRRLLCFGYVSPYKDYVGLARALAALPAGSFSELTIAGKLSEGFDLPKDQFSASVRLNLFLGFVPDDEVSSLFANADFVVLPYLSGLTSGVAALATGFGVPVIAPRLGAISEIVAQQNLPFLYDPDDPDGLRLALAMASELNDGEYARLRDSCHEAGDRIHPHRVSRKMLDVLQTRGIVSG
jgi:glycosyltransferase involved in cell wall biosynthesis